MSNRLKEKAEAEVKARQAEHEAKLLAGNAKEEIGDIPIIVSWEKINSEKPTWNVTIRGSNKALMITDIRDITDYRKFTDQCAKQLDMFFMPVKQIKTIWASMLRDAPKMDVKDADEDTTREGQFRELLEDFLTNRTRGQRREDLLRGAPWEDEEINRRYFTMGPLAKFLETQKMRNVDRKEIAAWIRALGGKPQHLSINNRPTRCWWVPSAAVVEAPELALPEEPEEAI
jgi:hypothetical protein